MAVEDMDFPPPVARPLTPTFQGMKRPHGAIAAGPADKRRKGNAFGATKAFNKPQGLPFPLKSEPLWEGV